MQEHNTQQRDYGLQVRRHLNSKPFRNCCYVSQHYSSHLRLTRQQDWTTSYCKTYLTGRNV